MSAAELVWAISGICALALLPVGAIRLVAWRSEEVDHTPALHLVARLALGLGVVAFGVFLFLTALFVARG